jgi:uncharacterized membrane protein YraQ (UPF0718 family)
MTALDIWNRASSFLLQCFSLSILIGLIPAFLIAGGINVFIPPALVFKYLGAKTNKIVSYSVATAAGVVLSVCSCTAIPLFAGIRKRGAGLGPAFAFLISAPGIAILPLVYTFRLLGDSFGWAYLAGAMALSVAIGLSMASIFYKDEKEPVANLKMALPDAKPVKKWWLQIVFFGLLIAVMILLGNQDWIASAIVWAVLAVFFIIFFSDEEFVEWMRATYQFVRVILPWLLLGTVGATLIAAFVPTAWVTNVAGGDSIFSCLFAALFGAFNYLCPPSQVLFTRAFVDLGMGQGPALSFMITGPAVSLPSVVILGKIVGWKKAFTYIGLLLVMATLMGYIYGLVR